MAIPSIQSAVQVFEPGLVGLNSRKSVLSPGPYQVLVRVETVGLCFSDLKLLKQFDKHPRKSQIISGIGNEILKEIPSYKPDLQPTVPGHETLCTIIAAGEKVTRHRVGQRVIIQADYRWLKTDGANAAFGYNFEGALQQYIIMDERIFVDLGKNESGLITVDEKLSDSAYALIEPWACVESSYITLERNAILAGGKMLIAVDADVRIENLKQCFAQGKPALITVHCQNGKQLKSLCNLRAAIVAVDDLELLTNEAFDDIIYFGSDAETIELLNDKIAAGGIINIVLGGKKIEREVSIGLGRVHYSRTRWIGTAGSDPRESYKIIPQTGEIRKADKIFIAGAAGPMGQMHTIRLLCSDVEDVSIRSE
ncbi:MAG: alcohol dehydrogenase catalytic domain-containing protein, partial [Phycisphaerae bacterium]